MSGKCDSKWTENPDFFQPRRGKLVRVLVVSSDSMDTLPTHTVSGSAIREMGAATVRFQR